MESADFFLQSQTDLQSVIDGIQSAADVPPLYAHTEEFLHQNQFGYAAECRRARRNQTWFTRKLLPVWRNLDRASAKKAGTLVKVERANYSFLKRAAPASIGTLSRYARSHRVFQWANVKTWHDHGACERRTVAVALDGHRLHGIPLPEGAPAGIYWMHNYELFPVSFADTPRFPDWCTIVPNPHDAQHVLYYDLHVDEDDKVPGDIVHYGLYAAAGELYTSDPEYDPYIKIQANHLEDATRLDVEYVALAGPTKPLYIMAKNESFAVMMPYAKRH